MLKIENTKVEGFEPAIRGMRNPMNSWEKSDSEFCHEDGERHDICGNIGPSFEDAGTIIIGRNDKDLMKKLASAGTDHAKYRRMIVVWCDILAPLYWWKEFDTYKIGTVANSCSTMHKIAEKEFTLDDFSHEHLDDSMTCCEFEHADPYETDHFTSLDILKIKIQALNFWRRVFLNTKDKYAWRQMIQLLDTSYNQRRTVMLNYEVLANIYPARKNHKLDEWHTFCDWIEGLPESWIITGEESI